VLDGSIDVGRRDGLDREAPITTHRKGQISGELSQLGDAPRSLAVAPVRKVASLFPSTPRISARS
jgi:thioredoxin reductase (NADPH)